MPTLSHPRRADNRRIAARLTRVSRVRSNVGLFLAGGAVAVALSLLFTIGGGDAGGGGGAGPGDATGPPGGGPAGAERGARARIADGDVAAVRPGRRHG